MGNLAFNWVDSGFLLPKIGKVAVILALLCMAFFIAAPITAKSYIYRVVREVSRVDMLWQTRNWNELSSDHFIVRYQSRDNNVAGMVLNEAEKSYSPVSERFKYSPKIKTLIVVYPSKESLGKSFGWDADESAMGVYWAGVIRVLSPNAWVEEKNPKQFKQVFETEGPVAHELTHLMVDYATGGNYTRWLTEGIAQYEEAKLTGYHMDHDRITNPSQMYPLSKMDREFDNLEDQNLAYYESLQAVNYLVKHYGENGVSELLKQLGAGNSMDQSFRKSFGISLAQFEKNFKNWSVSNQN